jgi:hypothetical protein
MAERRSLRGSADAPLGGAGMSDTAPLDSSTTLPLVARDSVPLGIVKAIADLLAQPSAWPQGQEFPGPAGLTVDRSQLRSFRVEDLPLAVPTLVDPGDGMVEKSTQVSMGWRESELLVAVVLRAAMEGDQPVEDAVDPLLVWCDAAVCADLTLGGVAMDVEPIGIAHYQAQDGDQPVAEAVRVYRVRAMYRRGVLTPDT